MDGRAEKVVGLGYEYADGAIGYLRERIPEKERLPLDMAVFAGSAAGALLATAYKNVFVIKENPEDAREWLASTLAAATKHIMDDFGHPIRILVVENEK